MSYLTVITLAQAKEYLRVDDTLTEDDAQITRMINGALAYVEKWTNILVFDREKTYLMVNGCINVYDYPINSVTTPTDINVDYKTLYNQYYTTSVDTSDLVLDVGYDDPDDIPQDIIEVAYEIISLFYYEKETGKGVKDLSSLSIDVLNTNKRFIL